MKKIRKIVALALATMMMMAMSITAFADQVGTTFTVTGLSSEETTNLKLYELATTTNGGFKFADWAEKYFVASKTDGEYVLATDSTTGKAYTWDDVKAAAQNSSATYFEYDTKKVNNAFETSHTFDGLTGAGYLLIATGTDYTYQVMCSKTYKYDETTGAYTLAPATVTAKLSNVPVTKSAEDGFAAVGDTEVFHINTAIPNNTSEFIIYDAAVNLEEMKITEIKLAGEALVKNNQPAYQFVWNDNEKLYTVNLSDLLTSDNVGKKLEITATAKVGSEIQFDDLTDSKGYAYKNTAYSNLMQPKTKPDVIGYTGGAEITKKDENGEKTLTGASFVVLDAAKKNVAVFDSNNKLAGWVALTDQTKLEDYDLEATNGTLKVTGLDEGSYFFHETVAPEGYELNSVDKDFTITADKTKNVLVDGLVMNDTKLVSLPFTGGMGTTIFTVLGVAIMALASALFFASKRRASK